MLYTINVLTQIATHLSLNYTTQVVLTWADGFMSKAGIAIWWLVQYKDAILPVQGIPLWRQDILWPSYLHNEISYTGKMTCLYCSALFIKVPVEHLDWMWIIFPLWPVEFLGKQGQWIVYLTKTGPNPDNKVHGANMGPSGADRTQVGPMLAPWNLLSGKTLVVTKYTPHDLVHLEGEFIQPAFFQVLWCCRYKWYINLWIQYRWMKEFYTLSYLLKRVSQLKSYSKSEIKNKTKPKQTEICRQ